MVIMWYGQSCFRIQGKTVTDDVTLVIDPYDKVGLKLPKLTADILCVTHDHYDHANVKAVSGEPFLISGPGEYERKGVSITGALAPHDNVEGKARGFVTMYTMNLEGMTLAHLGDLGTTELTEAQEEAIEDVDILLLPVGGVYTIDGKEAASLVARLEPRIVIPMHYRLPGLTVKLDGVETFLKHIGGKAGESVEKLKVSKKDLPQEETKIILLAAASQ